MGEPYIGEIRMFAGSFAPAGWMLCQGQTLPISENDALFVLLGTTYGGDGQETFNLPNLSSRVPIHQGTAPGGATFQMGEAAGTEQETLTVQQIPSHTHPLVGSASQATQGSPANNVFAQTINNVDLYNTDTSIIGPLPAGTASPAGGSQPHENCQPFLCINFIISLFGRFPSQT